MNVKPSNSQLNKLKSAIKNETDAVLRLSSNMIGNSDETNFRHKLLLTNRQVANLRKAFANHTSIHIKLSKSGLPLLKSVIKPLGALGLTDPAIHKKVLGKGNHTTLLISHDDLNDLLKVIKSLENSGILLDGITETVKNEVKEQKGGFLSTLLSVLGSALLSNIIW